MDIKAQYPAGTKLHLTEMKGEDLSPDTYTVDFVDDAGQIHLRELGLALIPEEDTFEYVCSGCEKAFTYPPANSRKDNSFICRICSAKEALTAAGIVDKEAILSEVRAYEYN